MFQCDIRGIDSSDNLLLPLLCGQREGATRHYQQTNYQNPGPGLHIVLTGLNSADGVRRNQLPLSPFTFGFRLGQPPWFAPVRNC